MRNSCLIDIRRCKMRGAYLVRSSQGAPEADITPELGNWKPPHGRAANQNAANFSYALKGSAFTDLFAALDHARFKRELGHP